MDSKREGWKVITIKTKEQAKAERLFNQYCYPGAWFWKYPEWKQAALDILSADIIEENALTGHLGHKKIYPVALGDLITDLVQRHFDYDVNLPSGQVSHRLEGPLEKEIVSEFDDHFRFVAAIARLGGIRSDLIQNIWDDWRKQVSTQVAKGKISPRWRQVIMDEIFPGYAAPKKIAYAFADIFLRYVPNEVPEVPPARIAQWVHVTLKSLGRRPVDDSVLREYVSNERQRISQLPTQITE